MTIFYDPDRRATLTVTEAAKILGISRTTAYESVGRGEIPARRFGRRIVVVRSELERLLDLMLPRRVGHGGLLECQATAAA